MFSYLFTGKGLDVLQAKIKPFEEYLAGLLKKPFLKESDILFTFLTSNDEFTMASSTLGVGKIINKVNPMKLTTKERGQNLQPFIDNFVDSTLSSPSKPRLEIYLKIIYFLILLNAIPYVCFLKRLFLISVP